MAEIRLSKLTKQFNIGLQTLVDFLNEKGAGVDMNPNAKISDSFLPAIESKFGDEQKLKQDSEKVAIKLKEIIELGSKKKTEEEDQDDAGVKEIIIKTNISSEAPVQQAERNRNSDCGGKTCSGHRRKENRRQTCRRPENNRQHRFVAT